MALISTISLDLGLKTSVLTVINSEAVETISYSIEQLLFDQRDDITISSIEFIDYVNQIKLFEESLLRNFSINPFIPIPFTKIDYNEEYDQNQNKWLYKFVVESNKKIADYTYNISSKSVTMKKRLQSAMITFPEWLVFINTLNHFKESVKTL